MLRYLVNYIQGRNVEEDISTLKAILEDYQNDELVIDDELLKYLCDVTKAHKTNRELLIISCHIISNLALDENHAMTMINFRVIKILTRVLKNHKEKKRLVWKCTSALWNLCRPVGIEDEIPDALPCLIFECMIMNQSCHRATHTCFGALSNLALCKPAELAALMNAENIELMLRIVWNYRDVSNVTGHFGAMIANISVVEDIASFCVERDCVRVLIECLKSTKEKESVKHIVAALHNISDVALFPYHICDCKGVETLREISKTHDLEIIEFISGIFELASMPPKATTSLQVAAVCCDIMIVVDLLKRNGELEKLDLDGKTCLQLAIEEKKGDIVQLLLASGAKFDQSYFEDHTAKEDAEELLPFIFKGKSIRFRSQRKLQSVMFRHAPKINPDVCSIVTECIPGVDLLLVLQ